MKLRYLTIQNRINADTVRAYAHENQLQMMEAKRLLEAKSETVLQYCDDNGNWVTVPYVVEYRKEDL